METYNLIKALHIISIIAWMAGLLYLPRLYVYHSEKLAEPVLNETFKTMERRLMLFIMNPAMISTWLFGLALVLYNKEAFIFTLWFLLKFLLVLILSAYHGFLSICRKNFLNKSNKRSSYFFRVINEVPTIVLILIVFLAVFKPNFF